MLKEAVASKAAKLLMTCVCPVAGTTALSLGVPQVRDAVYKATQPRQYAKPKTRVRQSEGAPTEVAVNDACPPVTPFKIDNLPPSNPPKDPPSDPPSTPPNDPPPPLPPLFPPRPPVVPPSGVPEPSTWLQLVIGFGLIGGIARGAYRENRRRTDVESGRS
ncbi:hypothetical protein [Rhizorhabdus argentea]|uniref:hypothetical protein n=1 Tax=Rhizorhabdus argentea TaxID=1387174 RepID=UPI0030ECE5B7